MKAAGVAVVVVAVAAVIVVVFAIVVVVVAAFAVEASGKQSCRLVKTLLLSNIPARP